MSSGFKLVRVEEGLGGWLNAKLVNPSLYLYASSRRRLTIGYHPDKGLARGVEYRAAKEAGVDLSRLVARLDELIAEGCIPYVSQEADKIEFQVPPRPRNKAHT